MAHNISAIILAAGRSQRMGQPKMLLPWRDTTVLGQVVLTFSKVGILNIYIITGGDRDVVEAEVARLANLCPVQAIHNPDFERGGMMSSFQVGLTATPHDCKAVLVGLGDQPQVEEKTLKDILAINKKTKAGIIVPSHENRRGHPVLIDTKYNPELLSFNPLSSLRDFINIHQDEIYYVNANASVLKDLDTPEDYHLYQKS